MGAIIVIVFIQMGAGEDAFLLGVGKTKNFGIFMLSILQGVFMTSLWAWGFPLFKSHASWPENRGVWKFMAPAGYLVYVIHFEWVAILVWMYSCILRQSGKSVTFTI